MSRRAVFLMLLGLGAASGLFKGTESLDLKLLDLQFSVLRAWSVKPAARDVAVIGIDEETVGALPEPIALWHPHLAKFLRAMAQAHPAVVGIDVVLPERSYDAVAPDYDRTLVRGIIEVRRVAPLVLARTVDPAGVPRNIHRPFVAAAGEGGTGYALWPIDRDGVVRRFDEHLGEGGEAVTTLVGQMARRIGIEPHPGLIDYAHGAPFDYVPFTRVLTWIDAGNVDELERAFGGRPVLLGTVLPFTDRQALPVALAGWEKEELRSSGVLLNAQALRNLLGPGFIAPVAPAVIVVLAAGAALAWFFTGGALAVALAACAIIAAAFSASTWLLHQGWFLPVSGPALTALAALLARNAYEAALKLRERRRLRASFAGYVSPTVMEEILAGRVQPELGGASKFVCVMFSDIRGYTARSEHMSPEQVIGFLNRYFERVVALIHASGGAVVSFMGDGIMAVFGAPKPLDNPCREAFEAARAMLDHVTELNERFRAEGEQPMEIGIGLHAGEAVIGHVGSSSRHDYTAIGDVTNVASRLESLTKEAGYRLICSRLVGERLGQTERLVFLGPKEIKGHSPVEVYGYDKT